MAVTAFVCPSCGASLKDSDNKESCFCQYCGTKFIKSEPIRREPAREAVEEEPLLERAFLFIEDGDFLHADKYLERVLDLNPKCSRAYIGKLLCVCRLRRSEQLCNTYKALTSYDYFNKAVRFASPEQAEEYQKLNAAVVQNFEREKDRIEDDISKINENILADQQYLTEHKEQYNKAVAKKILWNVLMVISICSVIFFTVGTITVLPIAVIDVPCIVWMIVMIRKTLKAKKATVAYNKIKLQLKQDQDLLIFRQNELEQWLSMNS